MTMNKWPKTFAPLTKDQEWISNDFMQHWHEVLRGNSAFNLIENFNHTFSIKHGSEDFLTTLEIGAGLGEHLKYEKLTTEQQNNYIALELRQNMAQKISEEHPHIKTCIADCQKEIPYPENYFDRIIAIHVLEHLPDLPKALAEIHRVCNKKNGIFTMVIPCEGGFLYNLSRKISAQRIFEKRYKQPYKWFIEREHVNLPEEIFVELKKFFTITKKQYFPFLAPWTNVNLCIGAVMKPHE